MTSWTDHPVDDIEVSDANDVGPNAQSLNKPTLIDESLCATLHQEKKWSLRKMAFLSEPALSWDDATGTSDNDSMIPIKIKGNNVLCHKLK